MVSAIGNFFFQGGNELKSAVFDMVVVRPYAQFVVKVARDHLD